jgi:TM2 domain-containing membrane protein YozV
MAPHGHKDRSVAILLALLLGGLGTHRFYLRQFKKGALYLVFCWTFIPAFVALYDSYRYYKHPEWFNTGVTAASASDLTGPADEKAGWSASTGPDETSADDGWSETTEAASAERRRDESVSTSNLTSSASGLADSVKKGASVAKESASSAAQSANERVQEASENAQAPAEQPEAPPDAEMAVRGVNGTVTLYDHRLEISRDDIGIAHKLQHGFKGDKEIPLESITSVQLRKPSSGMRGYIQFGQSGYAESDDGLFDAVSDENTVLFDTGEVPFFEELRTAVRERTSGAVEASTSSMDGAMEQLRERYAAGDIDEEEYEKRKEVLQND